MSVENSAWKVSCKCMVLGNATYLVRIKSCECVFLQGVIFQVELICIHNTTAVLGLGNITSQFSCCRVSLGAFWIVMFK